MSPSSADGRREPDALWVYRVRFSSASELSTGTSPSRRTIHSSRCRTLSGPARRPVTITDRDPRTPPHVDPIHIRHLTCRLPGRPPAPCGMTPDPTPWNVFRRRELLDAGHSRHTIDTAISRGVLTKLGRYWLGTPATPPRMADALRDDARLTCVDALALHGAWIPVVQGRHQVSLRRSTRLSPAGPSSVAPIGSRAVAATVVHHPWLRAWPDHEPLLPVALSLEHAARCLCPDDAAIVFESVAHLGLLPRSDIDGVLAGLPDKLHRAIGPVPSLAMSGTETRVRRFFEKLGCVVAAQWWVEDVGITDMRIGESLIIECDSRAHHFDPEAYARDRRRDRELVARGYRVVRLTWEDVMLRWVSTQEFLRRLIADDVHRRTLGGRGRETHPSLAPGGPTAS